MVEGGFTQMVKCLPTVRETRVQSLGREDPLEKEMATHSSILDLEPIRYLLSLAARMLFVTLIRTVLED